MSEGDRIGSQQLACLLLLGRSAPLKRSSTLSERIYLRAVFLDRPVGREVFGIKKWVQ